MRGEIFLGDLQIFIFYIFINLQLNEGFMLNFSYFFGIIVGIMKNAY